MLGQFIQVIAGAAPPALLLALAFAQFRALGGRRGWARATAWGTGAGALAGLALTVLRETTTLVNRETVNLWTITPAVALELWFVAWVWLSSRRRPSADAVRPRRASTAVSAAQGHTSADAVRPVPASAAVPAARASGRSLLGRSLLGRARSLAGRAGALAVGLMAALVTARAVPAVALQLTGFVVPGESPASTEMLLRVIGFAGGAALVWVAALTLFRSASAPARPERPAGRGPGARPQGELVRLICTSLAFGIVAVFQLVLVLRAVRAQWYMTFPSWLFRAMAWIINHEALQTAALIAASAAVPVAAWALARRPAGAGFNPAAARLRQAAARSRRRYSRAVLLSYAAMGLTVTAGVAIEARGPQLSPPEPFEQVDGLAVIPLDRIDDGHLHRFAYTTANGTVVRFIVIKKNGVAYGVGLDACEVCGDTGYYEKDGKIICRLCDVVMNIATIGFKGGCNPIPLEYDLVDATLTVDLADLEAGAGHFA
ncbi:MAG: DUF2318 domain-containing protein [Bifidobacteriaceae bacterium]|nr:DUF2318 domain-containing protein [Bifidobacteriaceae bacterium]